MPLRQSRERFRMDPRLREDDKQKTKETSKQESVWDGVECFCLQKACRTTDANSAQIRFHYRAIPTIAVILANAGIHLSACTEQCVGISTHSGKHSKCRESKVNAVVPSTEDHKQKTKETSKQENVWDGVEYFCLQKTAARQTRTALKFVSIIEPHPHYRHSRERGNPFIRAHRVVRWRKYSQRQTFQMPREHSECSRTINSQ
ncbi:hypothetical protein FR269_03300 [Vibrio vulnificus]|nr:hypothetical protein [Vibrio vulnificus]